MARGLNKVMLIGNLGKDPELRYTASGKAVANFSLATSESWKDADGNAQERTEWHNIVAWTKLAEICGEWLKKGKRVYIEGRIQTRNYDDKNTGQKRYITEIIADNMLMLDGGGGARNAALENSAGADQQAGSDAPAAPAQEEDLPF